VVLTVDVTVKLFEQKSDSEFMVSDTLHYQYLQRIFCQRFLFYFAFVVFCVTFLERTLDGVPKEVFLRQNCRLFLFNLT
jgi:hypothetical protein